MKYLHRDNWKQPYRPALVRTVSHHCNSPGVLGRALTRHHTRSTTPTVRSGLIYEAGEPHFLCEICVGDLFIAAVFCLL